MTPPFLDPVKLLEDFQQECFYQDNAIDYYGRKARTVKKAPYGDWAHFKIVRHRYNWEWYRKYIGVNFYGIMHFHKHEQGFWYLDHVTPMLLRNDELLQGKIIHGAAVDITDDDIEQAQPVDQEPIQQPLNKWEQRLLRFKQRA